jgi:formylglycine-generating enzyme required for sulfatase activity
MNRRRHNALTAVFLAVSALWARSESGPADMALIPEGVYRPLFRTQSDPKEVPVRKFYLDILPVTTGDFLEFVRANPRWRRSQVKRIFADESYLKNWAGDLELGTNAPAHTPATYVSWFAARAYALWKGKRLPTVAEWEYAASAGYTRPDGAVDAAFQLDVRRWYTTPAAGRLATVGADPANYWGVHNLHGLVWEWVADFNTTLASADARSDSGPDRQLFCGAGSLGARDLDNYPTFMRDAFRSSLKSDYCIHNLGFRCAKDL